MSDIIKKEESGLVDFLQNGGAIDIPKPFEREIYLFDTHIAGTTHISNIKELEPEIKVDDKLMFFREPENKYDPQAIRVQNLKGDKIGFVPQQDNVVFSRLMDAGKLLFGRVKSKELVGEWLKIEIKIFLED